MKLIDLHPRFIRYGVGGSNVDSLAEAQGIRFLCPKCMDAEKTGVGVHQCAIAFDGRGVADEYGSHQADGSPVRWTVSGNDYTDLTTTPSIQIVSGCRWHGFITNGEVSII